jgi:hypothetical protein
MELVKSADDWKWYKKKMEVEHKSEQHKGEPEKFPCKVKTSFDDGDYGDYTNDHEFLYEEDIKCDHCGYETRIWSDELTEAR